MGSEELVGFGPSLGCSGPLSSLMGEFLKESDWQTWKSDFPIFFLPRPPKPSFYLVLQVAEEASWPLPFLCGSDQQKRQSQQKTTFPSILSELGGVIMGRKSGS